MGPLNWVTPESMEDHRLSIEVWFRGKVTTIGEMEDTLIDEELDRMFPLYGDDNVVKIKCFQDRLMYSLNHVWCYNYLRSLNPDKYYKDKWVNK